jgi:hypothetical protein
MFLILKTTNLVLILFVFLQEQASNVLKKTCSSFESHENEQNHNNMISKEISSCKLQCTHTSCLTHSLTHTICCLIHPRRRGLEGMVTRMKNWYTLDCKLKRPSTLPSVWSRVDVAPILPKTIYYKIQKTEILAWTENQFWKWQLETYICTI